MKPQLFVAMTSSFLDQSVQHAGYGIMILEIAHMGQEYASIADRVDISLAPVLTHHLLFLNSEETGAKSPNSPILDHIGLDVHQAEVQKGELQQLLHIKIGTPVLVVSMGLNAVVAL